MQRLISAKFERLVVSLLRRYFEEKMTENFERPQVSSLCTDCPRYLASFFTKAYDWPVLKVSKHQIVPQIKLNDLLEDHF